NIRMIIPNTAFFANKESMLRARFSKKKDFIATRLEKVVMKAYIEKYKNFMLAYYHLPTIVTFKVFGVLPNNPWVMGTNNSAILCLDNGKLVADYVNAGVNRDKVAQIGSYKTDCYNNKSTHVDTIGFALPQMYEHDILDWEEHIEIIEGLLSGLELMEKDIVIFLHPKMDKAHYQYLEREYRCEISNQRTDLGLKHVDLYVATFSTTVFTATAYHVPSLVIDCFEAKYDMFDQYKSIQVFTDITNLLQRADGLTKNRNKFLELKKLVSDDAKRLGNEPGEGIKKLNDLIRG
ncbi:hypothetical protein BZG05_16120, partial [Salinivibrio kushneri]|uniref:hypothetical protein n=1 Tax=Salinivibrio kushneri TaxID=1908198 RepID=UPI0009C98F53